MQRATVTEKCVKAVMQYAEKYSMHRKERNARSITAVGSGMGLIPAENAINYRAILFWEPEIRVCLKKSL